MKTTALVTIFAIGSLVLIVMIAYLLRRKYFQSKRTQVLEKILPTEFKYDAFIIFNTEDQEWVNGTLLRIVEEHGFKCCVHYRDFEPGGVFVDTMSNSVRVSRTIIAVVSENFFKSKYCEFELNQAIYRLINKDDNSIIVIRKDTVSNDKLPKALKDRSFIDYSNSVERKSWVSKLTKALESNRNEEIQSRNRCTPV